MLSTDKQLSLNHTEYMAEDTLKEQERNKKKNVLIYKSIREKYLPVRLPMHHQDSSPIQNIERTVGPHIRLYMKDAKS